MSWNSDPDLVTDSRLQTERRMDGHGPNFRNEGTKHQLTLQQISVFYTEFVTTLIQALEMERY
jgi:hypothetical protein